MKSGAPGPLSSIIKAVFKTARGLIERVLDIGHDRIAGAERERRLLRLTNAFNTVFFLFVVIGGFINILAINPSVPLIAIFAAAAIILLACFLLTVRGRAKLSRRICLFTAEALFLATCHFSIDALKIGSHYSYVMILFILFPVFAAILEEPILLHGLMAPVCIGAFYLVTALLPKFTVEQLNAITIPNLAVTYIMIIIYTTLLVSVMLVMLSRIRRRSEKRVEDALAELQSEVEARKTAEEGLQASNSELQQFAYIAGHDLQEPLRKVATFCGMLDRDYRGKLDGTAMDYMDRMRSATRRMQALIDGLLGYSRVTTHAQDFVEVSLDAVLKEVLADLEVRVRETGAEIACEGLVTLRADPLQMRQLFQNLIGNALKYHKTGVPPRVEISRRVETGPNGLVTHTFAFKDNGIGFDNRHAGDVFQVFRRLVGKSAYEGTGIGLSICKKIVERHGGRIWAESAEGAGSTFYFTLPCKNEKGESYP